MTQLLLDEFLVVLNGTSVLLLHNLLAMLLLHQLLLLVRELLWLSVRSGSSRDQTIPCS